MVPGPWSASPIWNSALEDVPDLGEVVLVEGMVRARLVAHQPALGAVGRSGLGWKSILLSCPGQRSVSHGRSSACIASIGWWSRFEWGRPAHFRVHAPELGGEAARDPAVAPRGRDDVVGPARGVARQRFPAALARPGDLEVGLQHPHRAAPLEVPAQRDHHDRERGAHHHEDEEDGRHALPLADPSLRAVDQPGHLHLHRAVGVADDLHRAAGRAREQPPARPGPWRAQGRGPLQQGGLSRVHRSHHPASWHGVSPRSVTR